MLAQIENRCISVKQLNVGGRLVGTGSRGRTISEMPKAVTSHDRREEMEYDRANHEIHGTTRTIGVANSHNSIHETRPLSLFAIMRLLMRSSLRRHMLACH